MTTEKIQILGINIDTASLDALIEKSNSAIKKRGKIIHFACANAHSVITAQKNTEFFEALNNAEIVSADGSGITFMARVVSDEVPPRITGHDYFHSLLTKLNNSGGGRIFFFGSTEKVLNLIRKNLPQIFPNIEIAGTLSPPFREWSDDENDQMVNKINSAKADILWVGMTAPKQETWVYKNRNKLNTPIIGSVGAVFDFMAGTHPKAPDWMSKLGIEWIYRIMREPRRMGRRNLISIPKFVIAVIYSHIFNKNK